MLRANLNCYGNYTTDNVYQWDQNHTLRITGANIDDISAVHFCNKKCDMATVVNATKIENYIEVPIPNALLQEPYNIIAYVHAYNDNHAKTIEIINIPLIKRLKPDEYEFIDNKDIVNFERLEKDIRDFISDMTNDYKEFTTTIDQDQREFKSNFMDEYNEKVDNGYFLDPESAKKLPIVKSKKGNPITMIDTAGARLVELGVYGKSKHNGEPATYAPVDIMNVGDNGVIKIDVRNKNLISWPYYDGNGTKNGVTYTLREDGSILVNGATSPSDNSKDFEEALILSDEEDYILSGCPSGGDRLTYKLNLVTNVNGVRTVVATDRGEGVRFTAVNDGKTRYECTIHIQPGTTCDNLVFKPMLRRADTDETYKLGFKKVLTIPLEEPLRSVGDVADEIVCRNDVYGVIRRIGYIESYSGETITTDYISTTGELTIGASVLYVLNGEMFNPFYTDVNDEIKSLRTFEGVTTMITTEIGEIRADYHTNNVSSKLIINDVERLRSLEERYDADSLATNLKLGLDYPIKNMIKYPYSHTSSALFTDNGDGSITVNGSKVASGGVTGSWEYDCIALDDSYGINLAKELAGQVVKLTGASGSVLIFLKCKLQDGTEMTNLIDSGSGAISKIPNETIAIRLWLMVTPDITRDVKVYPMLRLANIEGDTWEPYIGGAHARLNALSDSVATINSNFKTVDVFLGSKEIASNDYENFLGDLPKGFTSENCAIISTTMINHDSNSVDDSFISIYDDNGSLVKLFPQTVIMGNNRIQARFWNLGKNARTFNYTIRYVLYRYA